MTYLLIPLVNVNPSATIVLICDDSDVFVYFCHFYHTLGMSNNVLMKSIESSKLYDIGKSCQNNQDILPNFLSAYCLSGTDVVCQMNTIRKVKVINALNKGMTLEKNSSVTSNLDECVDEATCFFSACFGTKDCSSMNNMMYEVWRNKTARGTCSLNTLPPTDAVFRENVKRARLQIQTVLAAEGQFKPVVDIKRDILPMCWYPTLQKRKMWMQKWKSMLRNVLFLL